VAIPEAFGMSGSTVSRRYIRASAGELKKLCERRLEGYDIVVLILDGKSFGPDEMVIALGVSSDPRERLRGRQLKRIKRRRLLRGILRYGPN